MRKITLYLLVLPLLLNAQINFEHGDWASVLAKAKQTDKIIMTDYYTDWCGPCKMMAKNVFTQKKVGDFYNANFVNYKINAEKGEGVALAKKYGIKAYPSYIFTDGQGNFLHKVVGQMPADDFINKGKEALDPAKQSQRLISAWDRLKKTEKSAYLRDLKKKRLPYIDKYESYIKSLSPKELFTKATYDLMLDLEGRLAEGFTYDVLYKNRAKFNEVLGKKEVDKTFFKRHLYDAFRVVGREKKVPLDAYLDQVAKKGFAFTDRLKDCYNLSGTVYQRKGYEAFVARAKAFVKKYGKEHPENVIAPVFMELSKFFNYHPSVAAYTLELLAYMDKAHYPSLAKSYFYVAYAYYLAEDFKEALRFNKKSLAWARKDKDQKGEEDALKAIDFIKKKISTEAKGDFTLTASGFERFNGMKARIDYLSDQQIGTFEQTDFYKIKGGKFVIKGNAKEPRPAVLSIYDGGTLKEQQDIVVEAGDYKLKNVNGLFVVENAFYHYYLFGLKEKPAYQKATSADKAQMLKENYQKTFKNKPSPRVKLFMVYALLAHTDAKEVSTEDMAYFEKKMPNHYLLATIKQMIKK